MSIPDYETLMLPLLRYLGNGERHIRDTVEELSKLYQLSIEEREELLPSGRNTIIYSRVHWAGTYLVEAGILVRPKRGFLTLTERGKLILTKNPTVINNEFLMQFPEFKTFRERSRKTPSNGGKIAITPTEPTKQTPEERIEAANQEINAALSTDLLDRIRTSPPEFFEQLIVELMLAMGYGAAGGGQRVGRSNDEGIDGIITEDALGLDLVYLQAKRYGEGNGIGIKEVQAFIGTLVVNGANKGVFVTTSHYTNQAKEFANKSRQRLILIDGEELTQLLIRYNVGVRVSRKIEVKRIDIDYFGGLE